jgi:Flp pilus assembly protein TadD
MRRGDAVTAMKDFRACVEIAPDFDRPYLNMTALLLQSGRTQEAHELLAGYLEKHPDNEEIKEALVQVDSKR